MTSSDGGRRSMMWPFALITALFFFSSLAYNLNDILIPQFKKAFGLNGYESGFVKFFFYVGYFICALPAGFFIRKFGYKTSVVAGLILFSVEGLIP